MPDPKLERRFADHSGGRPDERFPAPAAARPEVEPKEAMVSVVATVNVTRHAGKIRFVNPVTLARQSGTDPNSPVVLRVKSGSDQRLHEYRVLVNVYTELEPEADREGLVDAIVPISLTARAIELVIGGSVVDAVRVGGTLPAVRGVQRVATDTKGADILLTIDRQLDEGHTFSVQVSDDKGRTWRTVAVGLREPTFAIDRRQFGEGQELQVRIIATNGLSSSVAVSDPFRL